MQSSKVSCWELGMADTETATLQATRNLTAQEEHLDKKRDKKRCQDPFPLTSASQTIIVSPWDALFAPLRAATSTTCSTGANGKWLPIFLKEGYYEAFERILAESLEHVPGMRLLAYCLMPNHWHLVVWPRRDGELSDFGHWLIRTADAPLACALS